MSISENFNNSNYKFYPAYLSTGKEWKIVYYVFNPYTNEMQRFRIKLNRIKSISERRTFARKIIAELNNKLYNGWNPCIKATDKIIFKPLIQVIDTYKRAKFPELEQNTKRSYVSFLQKLSTYIEKNNKDILASDFNQPIASNMMLEIKENVGHRTFNNYLQFYRIFFNWLVEFGYCGSNPFLKIHPVSKRLCKKKRIALDREEIHSLISYLDTTHIRFSIICQLIYYCLLRPDDIVELRPENIDLENHLISIKGEATKNKKDSKRVIPKVLDNYFKCLCLDSISPSDFIFSDTKNYTLQPGPIKLCPRKLSRLWGNIVRKHFHWGLEYQLYGLKDTGITNLLADGISPAYVQGQADHSSLEITTKYVHTHTPEGFDQLRNFTKTI